MVLPFESVSPALQGIAATAGGPVASQGRVSLVPGERYCSKVALALCFAGNFFMMLRKGTPPMISRRARERSRFSRSMTLVGTLMALALTVVGCGASGSDEASNSSQDTITIGVVEPVGVLNPWDFLGQFHATDMIFEPLVAYGEGGELEPALAESWAVSDDGKTVTFQLRKDVKFHDGTDFDAEAAKFNLEQWAGKEEFNFLGTARVIASIETPESHTLELELSEPYPPLLQELTIVRPVRFLSPSSAPDGEYSEPIGTGPWKYEDSSDTSGTFVRNDDYWGEKPALKRAEMKVIPDSQTRVSALRAGEVDLIGGGYLAPINSVEAKDIAEDTSLTLLEGDADTSLSLTFNQDNLAKDHAIREALSLVTDVDSINETLYGNVENVAKSYFPPRVPHSGAAVDRPYDPDLAVKVLDDAGWKLENNTRVKDDEPLKLELLMVSDPIHGMMDSRTVGQVLQDETAKIGIDIELTVVDGTAYFEEVKEGKFDLIFSTTYGAPYDPTNTATSYLSSESDSSIWASPELDELLATAFQASEPEGLDNAYQDVYDYLEDETVFIPITNPPRYYAVRSEVQGFEVPPHEYRLDLTNVTIN